MFQKSSEKFCSSRTSRHWQLADLGMCQVSKNLVLRSISSNKIHIYGNMLRVNISIIIAHLCYQNTTSKIFMKSYYDSLMTL